ncbi:MAG TPA: helix-hairpin-helix domain-containing protein [Chthonomonadaceae bacterium]|nr:helix-hairpin-helix domain-containing protein [Chthonomonadaceae bacterium]
MPVVFVVLILTALAVAFSTSAQREIRAAANFTAQTQRFYAARGALNYAMSALAQTSNSGATYGIVPPGPETDTNGWMPVGDAWVKIEVTDTGGLINLNTVDQATLQRLPVLRDQPDLVAAILDWRSAGDQPSPNGAKSDYYQSLPTPYNAKEGAFDTVAELLLVRGMTPALLYGSVSGSPLPSSNGSLLGSGGTVGTGGYAGTRQAAPGGGQGQPGSGQAGTGQQGQGDQAAANTNFDDIFSNSTTPLAELLTTAVRERNVAADGSARININTATQQDLQQKLGLSGGQVRALLDYRNGGTGGFGGGRPRPGGGGQGQQGGGNNAPQGGGGRPRPGMQMQGGGVLGRPGSSRPGMQMESGGSLGRPGGGSRQAMPGGNGGGNSSGGNNPGGNSGGGNSPGGNSGGGSSQAFKSIADLLEVRGFTRTVMQRIADRVTVDDQPYRENVVNINTAPAEVLATVPGMERPVLDAILSYRQSGQAFQTLGDFFTLQSVNRQQFERVIGALTTKSSVYRVHIKVRMPGQPSVYAVSALVQVTENGPSVLQWQEVPRTPGWSSWTPPPTLPFPTYGGSGTGAAATEDNASGY